MRSVSANLVKRLQGVRSVPVGLTSDDVRQLQVTPDLVEDIFASLRSPDAFDQQMGLFFAEVLIWPSDLELEREVALVSRIGELAVGARSDVKSSALRMAARFHSGVPDFRSIMITALSSCDPDVRKHATLAYGLYSLPREVAPIEKFEFDSYMAEIAMCGPLIYELRNLALETIECVIRNKFRKAEKCESMPTGEMVYWWDWSPYHAWKKKQSSFLGRMLKRK